jgi:hypothetical protein
VEIDRQLGAELQGAWDNGNHATDAQQNAPTNALPEA